MNWQWTPYLIPLFIAIVTLTASAIFVLLRQDKVAGSWSVSLLMLATAEWSFGYALELSTVTFEAKMLWARLQYPGIAVGATALLVYTLYYTGREQWLTRRTFAGLSLIPVLTLLVVFSGDSYGLIWSQVGLDTSHSVLVLKQTFGIGFWIFVTYTYLQLFLVTIWLVEMFIRSHKLYRFQTSLLLIGIIAPWVGNLVDILQVVYLEVAPLAFSVTGLAVGWSLFRMRLGEVIPVAREAIINGMDDGVIVLDVQHQLVDFNPKAEKLLGQPDLVGQPIERVWPGWPAMLAQAQAEGGRGGEMVLDQADGRHIYDMHISSLFDWRKRLVSRVVVLRDITDRKKAEVALRESEEQLRATFEQAAVGIAHVAPEGRWLRVNQRLCDIVGYSREELSRLTFQEITHPADLAGNVVQLEQLLAGDIQNYILEKRYIHKNGSLVWANVTASLVRDEAGQPKYFIAVIEDIAQRKQTEQMLQKYTSELQRSNRELEQFAYIASHDLQEPLRKIQTFGSRLQAKYGPLLGESGLDYLTRMHNASDRMQALIQGLLNYSRVTTKARPFETVNLGEVVRGVLGDLEDRLEKSGGRVEVGDLPTLEADPTQMRQLFQNLLSNALKFHPEDHPPLVRIGVQAQPDEGALHPPMCQVVVEDNGIGFDEKHSEQIFHVFHRLHGRSEYEGTGIGLATCRKIVERHGGTIAARSAPGIGTKFIVNLPLRSIVDQFDIG